MSVNGTTLLRQACTRNDRQAVRSFGRAMPRSRSNISSKRPAMMVRAAMNVTGGIVPTPTLMKL